MEEVHGNVLAKIHRCDDGGTTIRGQLAGSAVEVSVCGGSAAGYGGVV